MTLSPDAQKQVYEHVSSWIDRRRPKQLQYKDAKPFHSRLLPPIIVRSSRFERSFSTGLGSTLEAAAHIVAKDHFPVAERQYLVEGFIPTDCLGEISRIEENLDRQQRAADYRTEVQHLVHLVEKDTTNRESRRVTADLYVRDKDGNETYFEIKGPKPNKGQCIAVTIKHLQIHCIRRRHFPQTKTHFGMTYHPFGEGNPYKHSFAKTYLDVKHHVLLGKAFWEYLGGPDTYEDILSVYETVGRDKAELIRDKVARMESSDI